MPRSIFRGVWPLLVVFFLLVSSSVFSDTKADTKAAAAGSPGPPVPTTLIRSCVIGSAGLPATDSRYSSIGTLGQSTPIGIASAIDKVLYAGFWPLFTGVFWPSDAPLDRPPADALLQNAPNPFRSSTAIVFALSRRMPVSAEIFDVTGARVRTLIQEPRAPGWHRVVWDGRDDLGNPAASGIYFCKYRTDAFQSVKKMLLLR